MQIRHVSCLMGHLSRELIVGGFWLGTGCEWGEAADVGQMQGLGNRGGLLKLSCSSEEGK